MLSQHIILRIVSGRTGLPTRSFKRGEAVPQFTVGSRGDWIVSAPGVASFHVLLTFDGEHVFAAAVDPAAAPVYLKGAPIGNDWNVVTPSVELRFGEASLVVAREASLAPPAGASPPRPPKPEYREALPPQTVRQAPSTAKHISEPSKVTAEAARQTGPGNTQFFEDLKAQVEPRVESTPPPPPVSADALMVAIAPTIARQPPTTFPMQPRSTSPQASGALPPSGAVPPPMISAPQSAPQPFQSSPPPPAPPLEAFPTAFSPQFPGHVPPGHTPTPYAPPTPLPSPPAGSLPNLPDLPALPNLPPAPLGNVPAGNLPTIASQSSLGNHAATGWSGGRALELPTHFAPPGSIALPPDNTPTALAPTDDGAPLPLPMQFGVPPLPLPPNAEGEPYSTLAADDEAIRNFVAHIPSSPPDPLLPPGNPSYPLAYTSSHPPPPAEAYPSAYLESQTPPPYAPPVRYSHNPRTRSQGGMRVLLILLPLMLVVIVVAIVWYLGVVR